MSGEKTREHANIERTSLGPDEVSGSAGGEELTRALLDISRASAPTPGAFGCLLGLDRLENVGVVRLVDGEASNVYPKEPGLAIFGLDVDQLVDDPKKFVFRADELWPRGERRRVRYFRDYSTVNGFSDVLLVALRDEQAFYGLVGVERRASDPPFGRMEMEGLATLAPALSLAAGAHMAQAALRREAAALRAIGKVHGGVLVVDCARGKVVWRDGGLERSAELEPSIVRWAQHSVSASSITTGAVLPLLPDGNIISFAPIQQGSLFGRGPHVAVHIVFEEERETRLRRLSGREREIGRLLADGYTHINVGAICGLSAHTVRTYIRRLYSKLGICNRADLVHALEGSRSSSAREGSGALRMTRPHGRNRTQKRSSRTM